VAAQAAPAMPENVFTLLISYVHKCTNHFEIKHRPPIPVGSLCFFMRGIHKEISYENCTHRAWQAGKRVVLLLDCIKNGCPFYKNHL